MPVSTGPVTLGDLIHEDELLWVYCRECCHERDVNPANVPLPADTPVPEIEERMKCSYCGSRTSPLPRSFTRVASRRCGRRPVDGAIAGGFVPLPTSSQLTAAATQALTDAGYEADTRESTRTPTINSVS